jgi:lipopolysaccharide transport system ATP-binding protein
MSKTVIEINNLGKQYRLGQVGTGSIADDLKRWWYVARGKEDPFLQIGEENDRTIVGSSDYVWALQDINFKVEQGDVLGIIGKNGAGKSTLLKILSRTTSPSVGEYKIKGRVASLLEVGTGFHPDLTGRENVFLNGAILGMTKAEIKKNFDEIVAFSGVERYIDTPVKRYSSGMYVRLAFAVAAHLNPEILIIDEVLAVGDAEFQKKCLGKMKDVSEKGRTVLFVSHNLTAVRTLCTKALYLQSGKFVAMGETSSIIDKYLIGDKINTTNGVIPENASTYRTEDARFLTFNLLNKKDEVIDTLYYEQNFVVEFTLEVNRTIEKAVVDFSVGTLDTRYTYSSTYDNFDGYMKLEKGVYKIRLELSPVITPGTYTFYMGIHDFENGGLTLDFIEKIGVVNVLQFKEKSGEKFPLNASFGNVRIDGNWKINKI